MLETVVYQPRETAVLDLFIAALIRERAEAMESEGYGESMNWREDVFTLYQVSRVVSAVAGVNQRARSSSS